MAPSENDLSRSSYYLRSSGSMALILLSLFLIVGTLYAFKSMRFIGSGVAATNTIYVSGEGEVFAVPDTATFSVTVMEQAKDVKSAQDAATKKNNAIIAYLKEQGVEEKDIKTTDYSVSPRYEYTGGGCTGGYCREGKQNLIGFEVSQTLSVKVKDTEAAGDILSGVGGLGATSVSSLTFTIADEDALSKEARDMAIADAQAKANDLAKSLGVELVRVVGFSENSGPMPYYAYGMGGGMEAKMMDASVAAPAPEIALGQNKISSNVSITYEIR